MEPAGEQDLAALDGPDDWVSLFLKEVDGHLPQDMEISAAPEIASESWLNNPRPADSSVSTRSSAAPETSGHTGDSAQDQLYLPSLDDLIADSSDTDPDGLFSGFEGLNNFDIGLPLPTECGSPGQQAQRSHADCLCCKHPSSSDNAQTSTAAAFPSDSTSSQQKFASTFGRSSALGIPPPAASAPGDMPSLVGLTAAQVADAIGLRAQPGNDIPAAPGPVSAQTPSQTPSQTGSASPSSRGKKKRTRDVDSSQTSANSAAAAAAAAAVPSSSSADHSTAAPAGQRSGSPDVSSSNAGMAAQSAKQQSSSLDSAHEEEQKRQARMQRNRESAHHSRQRKRMQMTEVEQRCEQLKQHNSQLNDLVGRLTAENIGLKQQLVGICQQAGLPLPPPPAAAVIPPFGFSHMGMPMMVPLPKVPIQRMPAVRPAPTSQLPGFAPTAQKQSSQQQPAQQAPNPVSSNPSSTRSGPQSQLVRGRKKAKQAATAGTALLALFSFAVFMGPLGSMQGLSQTAQQELPLGIHNSPRDEMRGGGRVLMSVPAGEEPMTGSRFNATQLQWPSQPNATQLQLFRRQQLLPSSNNLSLQEGSGENDVPVEAAKGQHSRHQLQNWAPDISADPGFNGLQSIMLKPSDKAAEQDALQQLKDLAPYALYSTYWDQAMSPAHLPAVQGAWPKALPGQQSDRGTGLTGFNSPTMCQQVFQSSAAEDSAQATQRAQRFLAAGTSMRGSASIALPPVQEAGYEQELSEGMHKKSRKKTIGCGEDDPSVVVSVMLPSKTEASDTEYTSLDQLYVVVLTPGVKYSTYSCLLPKPILV